MLAILETHPIQYHAPVYRVLQARFQVPVTVIYGSDFSVSGYRDREFEAEFAWDTDLLSGYSSVFLSKVSEGGARSYEEVTAEKLEEALRRVAPASVLISGYNHRFHRSAFYAAWRGRHPILFRAETTDHAQTRGEAKQWVRDQVLRSLYRRCGKLLYIGQHSHRHYKRLGRPDEQLIFSPYCVDTTPFETDEAARTRLRRATREGCRITDEQIAVLFSGKLSERKGPDLLLAAIKELPPEVRGNFAVVFLGSGKMKDELERMAQSPPSVNVHFAGFKNQTQLSPYYHAADLLAVPSRYSETWGLVVNDALHHGLPCVVSDAVGCAPDLIEAGVTGEVFMSNLASDLAHALRRAAKLVGNARVREDCRRKMESYTVERAAEGIAQAYHQVLAPEAGGYR